MGLKGKLGGDIGGLTELKSLWVSSIAVSFNQLVGAYNIYQNAITCFLTILHPFGSLESWWCLGGNLLSVH